MYDLLIRNARLLDGTGSPWYYGDLAVKDGIIAAMGALRGENARETFIWPRASSTFIPTATPPSWTAAAARAASSRA